MQSSQKNIRRVFDDLYLIPLTPLIRGFDDFISAWLYTGEKKILVDVGPSVTSGDLIAALRELNVDRLDTILLTHIHLDHAGGIGEIAKMYPDTPIVCHPAGIDHLVDPTALINGTVKALGDTGKAYGTIRPTDRKRLVDVEQFVTDSVFPILTPGHSPHHVSYVAGDYLFAGEASGVCFPLPSSREDYMRPATPPTFFLDITLKSIDDLIAQTPGTICFSHFGIKDYAVKMLTAHKHQLLLWRDHIRAEMKKNHGAEEFYEKCLETLLTSDPLMAGFSRLSMSVQERERGFLYNSIKGFKGYLKTVGDNS